MSKVIEYVESLLQEGASERMAVLFAVHHFKLGPLSAQQLWTYFDVSSKEFKGA